jgi:hypothetical protein
MTIFYDIDVYTVKQADQAILIIIFGLTLCSFIAHIIFGFRYRYSWHRLSIGVRKIYLVFLLHTNRHLSFLGSFLMCYLCLRFSWCVSSCYCKYKIKQKRYKTKMDILCYHLVLGR